MYGRIKGPPPIGKKETGGRRDKADGNREYIMPAKEGCKNIHSSKIEHEKDEIGYPVPPHAKDNSMHMTSIAARMPNDAWFDTCIVFRCPE